MIPYGTAQPPRGTTERAHVQRDAKRPLIAATLGVAATWSWEILLGGIPVAGWVVHPGYLAYLTLLVAALPVTWSAGEPRWQALWFFASAAALGDLPALAIRGTAQAEPVRDLAVGGALALAVLLPAALLGGARPGRSGHDGASLRAVAGVGAGALLTIGAFQVFNRMMRAAGVANEGRSLIVGGVEVHHLNWGVLLLVGAVLALSRFSPPRWARPALLAVVGLAIGLVADEWLYYAAREVTDEAYFEPLTWLSALLLVLVVLAAWSAWAVRGGSRRDRAPAA